MKIEVFNEESARLFLDGNSDFYQAVANNESIDAKSLSFEDKVLFFKTMLKYVALTNPSVLTNIVLLILGGALEDTVFEREDIYFSSITEYVDIKYELKEEIKEFNTELAKCYIGVLRSVGVFFDSEKAYMTNIYWNILNVATISQLGKILNNVDFKISETPLFKNSDVVINNLCSKNELANSLSKLFN